MKGNRKSDGCERKNTKWSIEETDWLRKVVLEIHPEETSHWQAVAVKMRQIGSDRSPSACKARGSVYLEELEPIDIKHNKTILQFITKSFSQGFSSKAIKQMLGRYEITSQQIRNVLAQRFSTIKIVVRKLVGVSKIRALRLQDYKVFEFMRQQAGGGFDLADIYDCCKEWNKLKAKKYAEQRTQIEEKLISFHSKFKESAKAYEEMDEKKMKASHQLTYEGQLSLKENFQDAPKAKDDNQNDEELASVFFNNNISWKDKEYSIAQLDEKEFDWRNHRTMADLDMLRATASDYSDYDEQERSRSNFLAEELHENRVSGYHMFEDSSLLC